MVSRGRIALPVFVSEVVSAVEMRQLVQALELRFQQLEDDLTAIEVDRIEFAETEDGTSTATDIDGNLSISVDNMESLKVTSRALTSADQTTLFLYDGTTGGMVRVEVGPANSGGAGYRALIVPN